MNQSTSRLKGEKQIYNYLKNLEARIARIEAHLKLKPTQKEEGTETSPLIPDNLSEKVDTLEFRIGQFWFAKAGIVVLAIGIAFLMTFPYQNLPSFFPSLMGYIIVTVILLLSHFWRNSFAFLSRYLLGGGLVLLYFATLRLHFYGEQPVLVNNTLLVILLLIISMLGLYISIRKTSVYLTSLILTLGYVTAIIANEALIIFCLLTLLTIISVYLKLKYEWMGILIYGTVLTYFFHLIWFINNPFLGNRIQLVSSPQINIYFILLYAVIFSLGNLLRSKNTPENNMVIFTTFLNCFGAYGLFLLVTTTKFTGHLFLYHFSASVVFLLLSILFWIKEKSKYSTFFFAILGYTALSAAIIVQFKLPNYFIWLCWQSLLVITTALWFRSKIIVRANFVIFLLIFLFYLMFAGNLGIISLSFGVVALLSARIMNWQKHRLELKTELMRNAYLSLAFVAIPYALYHSVPAKYISLSWIAVAIAYYLLSLLLKNKKYRWMALLTLLLSVLYILVIGLIKLEPVYRIISFIVLGIVLLVISLVYTKLRAKNDSGKTEVENKGQ